MSDFGFGSHPFLIAGPCAVEADEIMVRVADELVRIGDRLAVPVCFKASFDKANRATHSSPRGPGLEEGLRALERVRTATGLPILTDIHEVGHVAPVSEVVDGIQIPAFLSRQTDLLLAAGATGLPVNVKKGQWMAPDAMKGAVGKLRHAGATDVAVTERGTFLGYGDLVVDFRNLTKMGQMTDAAVIFDATHSVQQPGGAAGGASGGLRECIPDLIAAAAAVGVDGFFVETHPEPVNAISDGATQWPLADLYDLMARALRIRTTALESSNV